ncbi:MAG: hypothetical protein ACREGC_01560 [Minisyncoccia bacterium]
MKNIALFFLFAITHGFATQIVLENQTSYPSKGTKMAIQWAHSAKAVDEGNHALLHGETLQDSQKIKKPGKIHLAIPKRAEYFRVLIWSNGKGEPDFHTNWVEIVQYKVYTLKQDHLVPSALLSGAGC